MKLFFWKTERREDVLTRPIDRAIEEHKKMMRRWRDGEQKEIVTALVMHIFPGHHIHKNPAKGEKPSGLTEACPAIYHPQRR